MIFSTRQKAFISQSYPLAFHTGKSAAAGGEDGGGARLGEAAPKIVSWDNAAECLSTVCLDLKLKYLFGTHFSQEYVIISPRWVGGKLSNT